MMIFIEWFGKTVEKNGKWAKKGLAKKESLVIMKFPLGLEERSLEPFARSEEY